MLARLASHLPIGNCWRYEPKFDGFRGLVTLTADGHVRVTSRNGEDLSRWFPEIAQEGTVLPPGTIVDGELVVADATARSDFGALQARLTMNTNRLRDAAGARPAVLVAFDVLQLDGRCIVEQPLQARRRQLQELIEGLAQPCLQLVLQTADVNAALAWLAMPSIEGRRKASR
jgi:ATP-dependent DNA ligase